MQLVQVYLQPFQRKSLSKCELQNCKTHKNPFWGVQGHRF